jgi:hypothetical protein
MDKDTSHVSDDTKIAIPIRNLISIIGAVAVSTWAYNGITERLDFLEYTAESLLEEIEENDSWIDRYEPHGNIKANADMIRELQIRLSVAEEKLNNGGL